MLLRFVPLNLDQLTQSFFLMGGCKVTARILPELLHRLNQNEGCACHSLTSCHLKALGWFLCWCLRDGYEGGRFLNGYYLHFNRFKSFGTSKKDMAILAILNKEHEH